MAEVENAFQMQKTYYQTGTTLDYAYRVQMLRSLKSQIEKYEDAILKALNEDLKKPLMEAYGGEIAFVYEEIDYTLRHLKRWMKAKRKRTPILHFPANSRVYSEPYGSVLILAPWNYPFQLVISPLIGALAAGNCAVLKPSELAPHTAEVLAEMINSHFDPRALQVINGGVETAQALLQQPFDYIFFTGGTRVGKIVMKAAAEHLSPVTLELGGKSPAIVEASADLEVAARRVVWGKFFNAGQTCIAPDYVVVQKNVKDKFINLLTETIKSFFGENPAQSPDYARIINDNHFDRLRQLIDSQKIAYGGESDPDTRYIAPTILDDVSLEDAVMEEEIFGPILPVMTFENLEEVEHIIRQRPNPLALYLFTSDRTVEKKVFEHIPFGGGCLNDTLSHVFNEEMPFGGRGQSGMGAYHGKTSFLTFSHQKSVVRRKFRPDFDVRYPPYKMSSRALKFMMKIAGWLF